MGDCHHFPTVIPRSTQRRNDHNLLAHRRYTVQSNSNTVIIMYIASMTMYVSCCWQIVARQQRKGKNERGRALRGCKTATVAGREISRASKCNCIFARDAIDRSIDQSAKSRAFPRAQICSRGTDASCVRRASPRATRRLAPSVRFPRRDENYGSADRTIGSRGDISKFLCVAPKFHQ